MSITPRYATVVTCPIRELRHRINVPCGGARISETGRVGQFHRRGVGGVVWPTSGWRRWPADRLPSPIRRRLLLPFVDVEEPAARQTPANAGLHQLVEPLAAVGDCGETPGPAPGPVKHFLPCPDVR